MSRNAGDPVCVPVDISVLQARGVSDHADSDVHSQERVGWLLAGALLLVLLITPVACTSNAGRQPAATTTTVAVRASTTTTSQTTAATTASNAWTELYSSWFTPPVHLDASMAYDSDTHKVIMFGGQDSSGFLDDTWAYDPAFNTWTQLHPSGPLPPAQAYSSMAYDSDTHQVIMFGGGAESLLNDTWAYDPARQHLDRTFARRDIALGARLPLDGL